MNSYLKARKPVLLHVEDDDSTAYLFRLALREIDVNVDVFRTCNGEDAICFLARKGLFTEAPHPEVVVLDLHLPKKNGHDVLSEIRQQSALQYVPVIMLTSSKQQQDREKSLSLGANEHIYKPTDFDGFLEVAKRIVRHLGAK